MLESLEGKPRRRPGQAAAPGPSRGCSASPTARQQRAHPGGGPLDRRGRRRGLRSSSASGARAARRSSSSPATWPAAGSSRSPSASPWASSSTASAAAPARAGRCAPCRSAARSAPTCRRPRSTCRWTTRRFAAAGAMVGHGGVVVFDDTVDMARRRASPWSSAPRSRAASARRAASAPSAASR